MLKHKKLNFTNALSVGILSLLMNSAVSAGAKIDFGDEQFVTVGAGFRFSASSVEDAAPNGTDNSSNFNVTNMRLYIGGQIHEKIKFTFNTDEIFGDGPVDVLDAIAQFELSPMLNIWVGRLLTPADRIEMNGPFYGLSWNQYTQPLYASDQGGQAGTYGRDDGVTVWGAVDKFQYAVGFFEGVQGGPNQSDESLFALRLAYNFLNMEQNPGYYTSSTYYGGLGDIFTLAVSFQSQSDGVGSVAEPGDFSGFTVDALYENALENGDVLTVEAEYKDFSSDFTGVSAELTPMGGCDFCLFDGDSYFATVAYLFASDEFGKYQPYVRFVENDPSDADSSDLVEVGVNYIIKGHNARLNFNYSTGDANISGYPLADDINSVSFNVQLQL